MLLTFAVDIDNTLQPSKGESMNKKLHTASVDMHAPGSSSVSCCCNGSVQLNLRMTRILRVEVWELKLLLFTHLLEDKIKQNKVTPKRNAREMCEHAGKV